ncbi:MAG: CAP domain-containing protein [Caldilineaceae bacterium]
MKSITTCLLFLMLFAGNSVGVLASTLPTHAALTPIRSSTTATTSTSQTNLPTNTSSAWETIPLPAQVTTATIHSLAVHPLDANTVFMATAVGLYKTADAGNSWTRVNPTTFADVAEVLIATDNPQRLYVRAWGFYRSDDGGANWTQLNLPPSICGLNVAPAQADRLYARRCNVPNQPPVYRSNDGGQTWVTPNPNVTQTFDYLAVAPDQPDVLIATNFEQTFRSTNGGDSWDTVAIGKRYGSKPAFAPKSPYALYLGHWKGLLRSLDAGGTWQDSGADREFASLIVSNSNGAVMGGSAQASWQFQADAQRWSVTDWDAPTSLLNLWQSTTDSHMIYALSKTNLWRQQQTPTVTLPPLANPVAFVYLPVVQRARVRVASVTAAAVTGDPAIEQVNKYRAQIGALPLQSDPSLVASAQNHANYYLANANDNAAEIYGAHGEVDGKPHFTGRWPSDRIKATHYPWDGGSEVMHFIGDPILSVDGWMATIFHRLILLDPNAHYAGYAGATDANAAVDVMDFGAGPTDAGIWLSAAPYPLAYPANGQADVPPSWNGAEWPDPLPPGAKHPVGYPFTLQGIGGKLQVDSIQLRTATGQVVAVHPNPADCANGSCYALIAVEPLQPSTEYVVEAAGNVGGTAFQQQWHFTTSATNIMAAGVEKAR